MHTIGILGMFGQNNMVNDRISPDEVIEKDPFRWPVCELINIAVNK